MNKMDIVHARLYQARACVAAIDVVLGDRAAYPENDTMADNVLQGLASAAVDLLDQADEAAEGWSHTNAAIRAKKAVAHD